MRLPSRRALRRAAAGLAYPGLLRASGWLVAGSAIARALTLLAGVLVARLLVPADYGRLTLTLTAIGLLGGLSGLGLGLAVTRQIAETRVADPQVAARYVGSVLTLTLAGGVVVAVVVALARPLVADALLHDRRLATMIAAAALAVPVTALTTALQAALVGLEAFRRLALSQWMQGFALACGLLAGAATGGATGALLGFAGGQAVTAAGSLLLVRAGVGAIGARVAYRPRRYELERLLRFGAPAFGSFLAVSVALLGSQILLSHRAGGYAQVGLFSVAYRWHLAILFLPASASPVLVPLMTRLGAAGLPRNVASVFRGTMWGTFALSAVPAAVVAAAAPLLLGLSGGFYGHHATVLAILAVAAVPAALNNVLSGTSVSLGAMGAWLVSDLVLAAVTLGVAAALVGALRADGLALAYLAGFVATDVALAGPLARRLRASLASA